MALNYSSIYDIFGGEGATNDLIASFRSMGLDDATIDSVFAPYVTAAAPASSGALSQATTDNTAQASTTATSNVADTTASTADAAGALTQASTGSAASNAGASSAMSDAEAQALMEAQYATIGRTGVGTGANQIDQAGLQGWKDALIRGDINPADLDSRFSAAVTDYMAQNPNDQYTQYVKNYLGDQSGNATTGALAQVSGEDAFLDSQAQAQADNIAANNAYFRANPDVAAAYATNTYGLTPEQFAQHHFTHHGVDEGRKSPFQESSALVGVVDLNNGTYLTTDGMIVDTTGNAIRDTGSAATSTLTTQILGQNLTDKWSGQGWGSAQANAADMAAILSSIGITDIKQFGEVPLLMPVEEIGKTYNGNQVVKIDLGDGEIRNAVYQSTGQFDSDGNGIGQYVPIPKDAKTETLYGVSNGESYDAVDTSKVKIVDGKPVVDTGQITFGNKVTGEAVPNTYSERQTGNAFGGTFAGSGNTGYRVQFAADGTPIFYTTHASSSDIGNLAPLLAIASFVPGVAPFAQAINAAIAIDSGDVLGGLASLAGAGGFTDVATGLRVANALDQGNMGALASSLLQNPTVGALAGSTMLTDTISLADAGNAYNVVANVDAGNYAGALGSLGTLTNSSDLKTAGSALNLVNAVNSGNEVAIINAAAGLNNTIQAATNLTDANIAKSVTTSVSNGADAFVAAKTAGATDEEALIAANTVTGTGTDTGTGTSVSTTTNTQVTNNSVTGGTGNDVITTGTAGKFDQGEFEGVDRAIEQQSRNTEVDRLVTAYEKTTGKSFDKLTDQEVAALAFTANSMTVDQLKNASIQDILNKAPAIVGKDDQGRWVDDKGYAYDERGLKYAPGSTIPMIDVAGVGDRGVPTAAQNLDVAGNNLVNWANTLEGTSGDVVRQTLSTLIGAGGEQVADLGTALANMGVAERYNVLVQLGQSLERTGQSLEIPGVTQATENFWNDIQGAETYAGKAAASIKSVLNNPLVLTQVAKEGLQEVLPIVTGGAVFRILGKTAGIATDVLMNASESMGSQSRQKFNEEIQKGTPVDQAEKLANADGWKAFAITAGTATLADAALIKGYEKAMEKVFGKTATSVGKEWGEEGFEELAVALATGDDLATALSKSIAGSTIGSKTSGSLTAGSSVSADIQQAFASEGLTSSDGSFRPETITKITDTGTAGATGTTGTAGTTATDVAGSGTTATGANTAAVTNTAATGADTAAATDFASIFTSTGNTTQAVDTSVGSAISNGADVNSTITSVVNAANVTGANANVVAATATNAAVAAGADVATASNAATSAVSNVTAGTGATTAGTGTTTAGTGATTAGTGATTAGTGATTAGTGTTTAGTGATTAGTGTTTAGTGATTAGTGTATAGTGTTTAGTGATTAGTGATTAGTGATTAGTGTTTAGTGATTAGTGTTTAGTGTTTAGTGATTAGTGATTAGTGTTTAGTGATTAGTGTTTAGTGATTAGTGTATAGTGTATAGTGTAATTGTGVTTGTATGANTTTTTGATTGANTGTTTSTNAATGATTSTNAATGVTSSTTSDANTGTTTTTTSNATTGTTTAVSTNNTTGVTTTTNNNATTGVGTTTTNNTTTGVTTNTVVGTNTDLTTTLNVNTGTGEIISVDGPGKVIDSNTVVVDGTAIDVTTGEVLTPEEVEKRKEAAKLKLATPKKQTPGVMAGPSFSEPTYKAKDSDIAETWLGGRFRNLAPLAGLGALLPQDTPMFQEAQALSALRRASGIEDGAEKPEADYYAYGTEPSYSKVLEPFMNGGTVQKYADGGKIMASPLMAASGGDVPHKGSHYVQGAGGGQDDLISAKLADGEYVFDADIVAALGDGSNKEGAKRLDAMREAIRKHKRGGSIKSIPPAAKSPLAYLKGAL